MKTMLTKIAILTGCLTLSACVFSDSAEKSGVLTKEDAKNITNPGEDLCDVYNWYGDGQCDTFCENADPDCGQCNGYPVCPDGFSEVEDCVGDVCLATSLCGITIQCEEIGVCLAGPPQEICPEGYEMVDSCATDDCYEISSYCGGRPMFCQALDTCAAYPSCPPDTYEVEACYDGDQDCFDQTLCGSTIHCTPQVFNCDAYPVCPEGMVEVEVCQDDRPCPTATLCGYTISCQTGEQCDQAPECPQGYYLVEKCASETSCYEEVICNTTIACMEGSIDCFAPPMCPVGTTEVPACDPNRPCQEHIECGMRLYCEDFVR